MIIDEQAVLEFMTKQAYKPLKIEELLEQMAVEAPEQETVKALLKQMEQNGDIFRNRKGGYGTAKRMNLIRGRISANARGFAFLVPDEADEEDFYIGPNDLGDALNGDIVLARKSFTDASGRPAGEVIRILKRATQYVVGTFFKFPSHGFVVSDDARINRDILIDPNHFLGALDKQKVVVQLRFSDEGNVYNGGLERREASALHGEITEVLGNKDDPGVDILGIIRAHQLPEQFPQDVLDEAEKVPEFITDAEVAGQGRRDLRGRTIVTIDGEDAKDLDDAVDVAILDNGNFRLGVHIADVGYYVREGSKLDIEAYRRGCSVYLVDRVIPMLPERLSNGICSLHPHVDRLTLSCEMEFDRATFKRVRHEVFASVINTTERMTYTNVRKILRNEDESVTARYAPLLDFFNLMEELADGLRSQRMRRGAVDFDFVEAKVIVDALGKPTDIVKRERSVAESIIEEFMLAANETVAEHFHKLHVPFVYRNHEDPDPDKLQNFVEVAANFGYQVRRSGDGKIKPKALQGLLTEMKGKKEETTLSTMMLRSMKQAKYEAQSTGHFGLAAEFYTHFTSPIRRYPDLSIHRVMREVFEAGGKKLRDDREEQLKARMPDVAQQSSERERAAVEAERDTLKLKKAEFMLDKVGEEFDGIISGLTNFGIFVELDNTVEGLIRLSNLSDDYYHYDEKSMTLVGEHTSHIFRLGEEIRIKLEEVNMAEYQISFALVRHETDYGHVAAPVAGGGARGGGRGGFGGGGRGGFGGGAGGGARSGGGHGGRGGRSEAGGRHNGGNGGRGNGGKAAGDHNGNSGAGSNGGGSKAGYGTGGGKVASGHNGGGGGKAAKGGKVGKSGRGAKAHGDIVPSVAEDMWSKITSSADSAPQPNHRYRGKQEPTSGGAKGGNKGGKGKQGSGGKSGQKNKRR